MPLVTELTDLQQLEDYRLLWKQLWGQTPGASWFQSLDWLIEHWRHFGQHDQLRVLVVHDQQGQPLGIVPLAVRREATRLGTMRVLTYPLKDWATFYGPLGSQPTATLTAALGHIARTRRDWDVIDLRWVDRHGHDRGRTAQAMRHVGFDVYEKPWSRSGTIDLQVGTDAYWNSRDPKWRQNLARIERKLHRESRVEWVRYRPAGTIYGDDDPRWDLYDACVEVARNSWQGAHVAGTALSAPRVRDYLRAAHEAAVRGGAVDLNLLRIDGRPAAFAYGYHARGRVIPIRIGFDAAVSKTGAGTLLTGLMVRDGFARGDAEYELGACCFHWKKWWVNRVDTSYRCTHFPTYSLRAQTMRLKRLFEPRAVAGNEAALAAC